MLSHLANMSLHDAPDQNYNEHWGNHLLKFLQRNDAEEKRVFFDDSRSASTNNDKTVNAFKKVSTNTIEQLKKLYLDDFNIMSYALNIPNII